MPFRSQHAILKVLAAKITNLEALFAAGCCKVCNHLYKMNRAVGRIRYFCLMEVNDQLVNKLATLARLRFNEIETASIKNDLQKMIAFVQKMDEVDTTGVAPLQHMSNRENVWRDDIVMGSCSKEDALKNAAQHNKDFFMVPTMIKK